MTVLLEDGAVKWDMEEVLYPGLLATPEAH